MLMRSFHKSITAVFSLFALSLSSQLPLAAQSMDDAVQYSADDPAIAQWQILQIPDYSLDSTTKPPQQNLNLADQIPSIQIFIPPSRPTQDRQGIQRLQSAPPSFSSNKPTDSSSYGDRPSLGDVMRVQSAPLPYFIYQAETKLPDR